MKKEQFRSIYPFRLSYLFIFLTVIFSAACGQQNDGQENLTTNLSDSDQINEPVTDMAIENLDVIVGDPVSYKGLQLFPLYLKDQKRDLNYLTLSEAIKEKKLVVQETSNVNQLTVSNVSDSYVFIMAGDIIKGGKQDRTLGVDAIIPPGAKELPIDSYCVESGRWQKRGTENVAEFTENTKVLSSRKLKLASKYDKNQAKVWSNVAEQQEKLNKKVSDYKGEQVDVRSEESESSLQLTLESKDLNEIIVEYKEHFSDLFTSTRITYGYAYAINGELYGIDVFHDPGLFYRLSSRLYESVIVEAISDYDPESMAEPLSKDDVYALYVHQFDEKPEVTSVNKVTEMTTIDSKEAVMFETANSEKQLWVHKNYIPKKEEDREDVSQQRLVR